MTTPSQQPGFEAEFRVRLKAARKAVGLTQAQVAQRAGAFGFEVAQPTIARIEAGDRAIGLDEAAALALAVSRSLLDMLAPELVARAAEGTDVVDERDRLFRERENEIQLVALRAEVATSGAKLARISGLLVKGVSDLLGSGALPVTPFDIYGLDEADAGAPPGLEVDQAETNAEPEKPPARARKQRAPARQPRTKKKGAGSGRHHEV